MKKTRIKIIISIISALIVGFIVYGITSGFFSSASVNTPGGGNNTSTTNKDVATGSYITSGKVTFANDTPATDLYVCFGSGASSQCFPTNDDGNYIATFSTPGQMFMSFFKGSDENVTYHIIDNPESNYFISEKYDNFDMVIEPNP